MDTPLSNHLPLLSAKSEVEFIMWFGIVTLTGSSFGGLYGQLVLEAPGGSGVRSGGVKRAEVALHGNDMHEQGRSHGALL